MFIALLVLAIINIFCLFLLYQRQQSVEKVIRDELALNRQELSKTVESFRDAILQQLTASTQLNEVKLENVRKTVDENLKNLQQDNNQKLEQMRETVDEKLQSTLERRLGDSFKIVSDRLEKVHAGLGEMQTLATGVGDLKKVLNNVKAKGIMGEIQLGALLEQILSPEQYESNVVTRREGRDTVEFVVKLPGTGEAPVFLPIDSKFPTVVYERLINAQDEGEKIIVEEAAKALEAQIKMEAKKISEKYIEPPNTTDFAVMFLPFEGLYAEVLRRPGLFETLRRDYKITIAGPTTIVALLNSLQMGFRTLAVQKRASEVWEILGTVKSEFGKFGAVLEATKKKLDQASKEIDGAAVRSRAIERNLRDVQELPASAKVNIVPLLETQDELI